MLRVPRRVRKSLLVLLALFMALTVAQIGPGAPSALAVEVERKCSPEWATRVLNTGTGINIIERCEPRTVEDPYDPAKDKIVWDWVHYRFQSGSQNSRILWDSNCASPGYIMVMSGLMGNGSGGGIAGTKVVNYDCNLNNLDRPSAARVVIQYNRPDGWYTCNDSGWKQATSGRVATFFNQGSEPDCGAGSYRALASGRVWSNTLNNWITRGWIATPAISLSGGCCVTEPGVTPTPTPPTPD